MPRASQRMANLSKMILTHNKYTKKTNNLQNHSLKSKEKKNTGESHDQPVSSQLNPTIENRHGLLLQIY